MSPNTGVLQVLQDGRSLFATAISPPLLFCTPSHLLMARPSSHGQGPALLLCQDSSQHQPGKWSHCSMCHGVQWTGAKGHGAAQSRELRAKPAASPRHHPLSCCRAAQAQLPQEPHLPGTCRAHLGCSALCHHCLSPRQQGPAPSPHKHKDLFTGAM